MNNKEHTNRDEQLIQNALGAFLRARNGLSNVDSESQHLDEDVLSAFVEGSLSESEAKPVVSHMADCGYCLHVSAELIKLDLAFADEARPAALPEAEPSKVSEVLGGILSRIFGTNDGAVFAHEEKSEDENVDAEKEDE
ncbi:MAG: hypothetical protein HKN33_18640 [Pyrinomonadaceae bacterium]|nr:hypothetical protein [Pyrinomonadaceae bacterium]